MTEGPEERGQADVRTLRLFDLAPYESVMVRCGCGRTTEYGTGLLQRRYRLPSDTLLYDLQFRMRCSHCNSRRGFRISAQDRRAMGNSSKSPEELVIVPGEG